MKYVPANRKLRRQHERRGDALPGGLVAVHADGCPLNTAPRVGQSTMAVATRAGAAALTRGGPVGHRRTGGGP